MRKPLGHFFQMRIKSAISAFVLPARRDLVGCIAEDGTKLMLYLNRVAKLFFDFAGSSSQRIIE